MLVELLARTVVAPRVSGSIEPTLGGGGGAGSVEQAVHHPHSAFHGRGRGVPLAVSFKIAA